jgi:hypothetical protein
MFRVRRTAILLALAAASLTAGENPRTFTGTVVDDDCGAHCATFCPLVKGIRYTLQAGDEAYVLSDQKTAAHYAGKQVVVKGTLTITNRLQVSSISLSPATAR